MAAAYAALVSVMHIIEQINHHPRPPISLDKTQIEFLTEKVMILQEFLEGFSHVGNTKEADALVSRIADAAYAAEDVIESHIVDQILAASSTSHSKKVRHFNFFRGFQRAISHGKNIISMDFNEGLKKVVKDMDIIKKEVMKIKEKMGIQDDQLQRNSTAASSLRSSSTGQNTMVGFDDVLLELMEKLNGGQLDRQIIPIVGMGGIGKTTLARNVYTNSLTVEYFDICLWVTISQEYIMRELLLELLCQENKESREKLSGMGESELKEKLYKKLWGKRYLVVMDDMWSMEVWENMKFLFPENKNRSRIMITTRLSNIAFQLIGSHGLKMNLLEEDKSWILLHKIVFGEVEYCPLELQEIGKRIAKNCKGLPLSIVVIGGLLTKSEQTKQYWEFVATNLNEIVILEDDERCLKILYTSYNQLPVHLKPCFLYMGVFHEENEVRVSRLIKLWAAEGFLKPISGKELEVVAEEYLKELIDRNLIFVSKVGLTGKTKSCVIHDLLRDLCLREAHKQNFLCVTRPHCLRRINTQRRIGIHQSTPKKDFIRALQSASLVRSLVGSFQDVLPSMKFRLLRVLQTLENGLSKRYHYSLEAVFEQVNLRYLAITSDADSGFPSSVYLLWNLQTLIVNGISDVAPIPLPRLPSSVDLQSNIGVFTFKATSNLRVAPSEIWKMSQLRHIQFDRLELPNPPSVPMDGQDDFVLGNLQTLVRIKNFKCSEEVVKRIPNVKKLEIFYTDYEEGSDCCYNNLGRLHKLESLSCSFPRLMMLSWDDSLENISFPLSLKKLTLRHTQLPLAYLSTEIASLPHLEVLKLGSSSIIEAQEWETTEGQFRSLKFLLIASVNLESWITDSTHFPRLERLVLRDLPFFKEIPWGIGEIPTLQSIEVDGCNKSVVISAREILDEQRELGNEGLQVRVHDSLEDYRRAW